MKFPKYPFTDGQLAEVVLIGESAWRILLYLIANARDMPIEGELGRAGVIAISDDKLAAGAGVASRTVRDAIPRLKQIGAIQAKRVNGRATTYTVCPRWVPPVTDREPRRPTAKVRRGSPRRATAEVDRGEPRQSTGEVKITDASEPRRAAAEVPLEPRRVTAKVSPSPIQDTPAHVQDVKTSTGLPRAETARASAKESSRDPLLPSERADWNHEGKPTEAHWRALEDLTWRTYGVETDRAALDWYDMNAWRRRMTTLNDAQAS